MKLSTAIKEGVRRTKPAKHCYWRANPDGTIAASALGAAVIGAAGLDVVGALPAPNEFPAIQSYLGDALDATVRPDALSAALVRTGAATPHHAESWAEELDTVYMRVDGIPLTGVVTWLNKYNLTRTEIAEIVEDLGY